MVLKIIVGCETQDIRGDNSQQLCVNCDLKKLHPDRNDFEQKCESKRMVIDAKPIWNGGPVVMLSNPVTMETSLEKINKVEFNGNIDEYAKALNGIGEKKVTEDQAEELEKGGNGKRKCDDGSCSIKEKAEIKKLIEDRKKTIKYCAEEH